MGKNLLKNNRGGSLITAILLILVAILVVFLAYEIMCEDILGIMSDFENNPIIVYADVNNVSNKNNTSNKNENVEIITPLLNETNYELSENISETKTYYYNQLDDAGKIIYKGLEDNKENMKSGNYKINFGKQFNKLLNSGNGEQKLNIAFQSAWNAFTYDNVDIFYIDVTKLILSTQTTKIASFATHKVDLSNGSNANYFKNGIKSEIELRQKVEYIKSVRQNIVEQLKDYSDYEKIMHLHNWMVDNLEYDVTLQKDNIHNVYGAFANRKIVCEGYARTFKYVLDGLGIESVLVSGIATNSQGETETHAWNYVKLDGKWYAVDVTWDDPVINGGGKLNNKLRYQYFLKGSDEFFKNHTEIGELSENSIKFEFPTIEKENYSK